MSNSELAVPDPQPWKQTCMDPVLPTVYPGTIWLLECGQHHLRWPRVGGYVHHGTAM